MMVDCVVPIIVIDEVMRSFKFHHLKPSHPYYAVLYVPVLVVVEKTVVVLRYAGQTTAVNVQ